MYEDLIRKINSGCRCEFRPLVKSDVFQFRQHFGKNISHVIDIGANIGMFTMAAAVYWPRAYIHAIEPCYETYITLLSNTFLFNRSNNIICHCAGFGVDGFVSSTYDNVHRLANIAKPQEKKQDDSIISYSLPSFFKKFNIEKEYVIKMDCEGSEKYMIGDRESEEIIRNSLHFGMEAHFQGPRSHGKDFFATFEEIDTWIRDSFADTHLITYHKSNADRGYGHYCLKRY